MKRLSTFLLLAFLGITVAKAQSDLLYVAGENDATPGDAPTLYVSGGEDLYVQGGVVLSNTNTRGDGLVQTNGTLHIGNYASVGSGNWSNNTGGSVYTYSKTSTPANSYKPSASSIYYGDSSNTVSLEYGNQLIVGGIVGTPNIADTTYFYNLSLLDSAVNRTTVHSYKTVVGADVYVGFSSTATGILDLNDEYLNTQNFIVHVQNPSTSTSGRNVAISRIDDYGTPVLGNSAPFSNTINGGMVIAGNVALGQTYGRLARFTNSTTPYFYPVGTLVTIPSGYGTGQAYDLFRPAQITPTNPGLNQSFGVALVARDGFVDAGSALDQQLADYHSLAGINHQSYYKINQVGGGSITNSAQIGFTHTFYDNSDANEYPNWSTCGNLPGQDFPQTITLAQWDNNGTNVSWNDVCHNTGVSSVFNDLSSTCGTVVVTPDSGFCNNTQQGLAPQQLSLTSTFAYQIPGSFNGSIGTNTQEDYTVAGLFFTVDGGTGSCDGNCAALPINIIGLTGWNLPNQYANQLQWITATEENVDFFYVERSVDGINFTNISGENGVAAKGFSNSQQTYTFFDQQPNIGVNYYKVYEYYSGSTPVVTNMIQINLNRSITIANIYPNPTTGLLNISLQTSNTGTAHVEIYDVLGRLVMTTDHAVAEGNNIITLDATTLTAGSYFIRLTDAASGYTDTQKFIKITE